MSQHDIMEFLDKHQGNYYSAKQISQNINCNIRNTYRNLRKVIRREEYSMMIIPNDKSGRGSNVKMLYAYKPMEE